MRRTSLTFGISRFFKAKANGAWLRHPRGLGSSPLARCAQMLRALWVSVSTVCLYINKQANAGPYLERRKVQQLPEHFGPERPSAVLQQAVQACIDCAHQQKLVFSLVKQGYGGEMVSGKALEQVV